MAFSFLVCRRFRHIFFLLKPPPVSLAVTRHLANTAVATPLPSARPDPKISLSARLSFVFDQIDALERQRDTTAKDEALQRIRAWRQSKHPSPPPSSNTSTTDADSAADGGSNSADVRMKEDANSAELGMAELFRREIEVVHPWPEWIELMERLASQNYFDFRRVEEDRVAASAGIDISGVKEEVGLDLTRDWAAVRTACMNFGRDRFDILKSLARKDIQVLVGDGCPSMQPKVVFSAKLLRKYLHIDEGDVCSSCSLRNSCSRGYILVPKEDEARTLDVMRILLTYGFDHVKESVENDSLRKKKSVKIVVRTLLHEVVKLSAVPRDPNLLPPVVKKQPPKVKQPPPQPKRRVGRDDVEMKKGDWLCPKCDFMNFAKNTVCLQCDAKRPKRQLLPGEWECPKCNFLNYRRNMSCFQCEHNRPPDDFTENQMLGKQRGPNTRLQRAVRTSDFSNEWNLDFEDNESDGADVAAFEFADSTRACDRSSFNELPRGGNAREFEDVVGHQDRGRYFSNPSKGGSSSHSRVTGFDDFDDEEDNVDSYELDEADGKETHVILRKSLSEFESGSESEDFDDLDRYSNSNQHRKDYLSKFEDENIAISARNIDDSPNSFKSGNERELLDSDHAMQGKYDLKHRRKVQQKADRKGFARGRDSDYNDRLPVSDFDDVEDDDDDLYSNRSKLKGRKGAVERMGHICQDSYRFDPKNDRRNYYDNDDDEDDELYYSGSRNRGSRGASKSSGHRFQDSNRVYSRNIGKKFDDRGVSDLRRGRINQSSYGARGFQKSEKGPRGNGYGRRNDDHGYQHSARTADHSKINHPRYGKKSRNHGQIRGVNDDYDFNDNNQRRRIIER
ncbi:uncharacterized protein LOC110023043 [Phalaenopsis equestris]|uniref:uncharacterized protein LOC110023043 n=1 Tax=Phalaenopsis equestris TaxID=78828 RepID=UPI0009E56686|nr:uncharacterized protein LOC110023043 [Phalaenopsis equestris]